MKKKQFLNIALAAFLIFSVLALRRTGAESHAQGPLAAELTVETTVSGEVESRTYVNFDGEPVVPADRDYATVLLTRDDGGNVILEQYLDAQGAPVLRSGNYAAVSYDRGDGEIWITYLDEALGPATITSGYSSIRRTLDAGGKALSDSYYDLRGRAVKCSGGYYGRLRNYDSQGWVVEIVYLDANGEPMQSKAGYSREVRILDDFGRISAVYYRDAAGNPTTGSLGQYGEGYQQDENGQVSCITYLDASGKPMATTAGYTMLRRTYYRDGSLCEDRYFDAAGNPVALSKGQYGVRRVGDVSLQLNKNGNLMLSVDNLLTGYPLVVVLAGCLLCAAMCWLPKKPRAALLAAYVVFIFYETLMFRETGDSRTALIPFAYLDRFWKSYSVRAEVINNIWLFVPLGAGLYSLTQNRRVLWIPFLLTVGIELTQYLTGLGLAQTDDILGYTFGALAGFLLAARLQEFGRRLLHKKPTAESQ